MPMIRASALVLLVPLNLAADPARVDTPPPQVVAESQITNPAGSQAPGDQYIFFGANPDAKQRRPDSPDSDLVKLVDFSVDPVIGGNGHLLPIDPNSNDSAKVTVPGVGAVSPGLVYNDAGGANSYSDLATFRVTNPSVTSFSFWVLDSTIPLAGNGNAGLAIRMNGSDVVAPKTTVQTANGNEFTKFTVHGASTFDTFTVAALSDGKGAKRNIAGLTFQVIPDPEMVGKKFPIIYQSGWNDLNKNGSKDVYEDPTQPIDKRVEDLLRQMTQEEKVGQLNQVVSDWTREKDSLLFGPLRRGEISAFIWSVPNPALHNQFQRLSVEGTRLGIPLLFGNDIIHGATTLFPIALGLSCAFDPDLFEKAQTVAAREARAEGVEWVFAPMCDLARDPRWGRVAETCGEDPYLSSLCNAAQVRGFQGKDPSAPDRVAACLKHYVGYSATTGGRDKNDTEISEWTLRNMHLPPFHAGIDAGALTVMSAFNAIDGIPSVANHHTLTDILRGEWKFPGFVVSDWAAVNQEINWGYVLDAAEATDMAINAGNDMDMLSNAYREHLAAEVQEGHVSQATVDEAVRRVLWVKFRLGLFDRPYVDEKGYRSAQMHPDDVALARECVAKSTVLLKNNGVLPLSTEVKKVALIGPVGDDPVEIWGCWPGRANWGTTLAQGFKEKFGANVALTVVKGCDISTTPRTKTLEDGSTVLDTSLPPLTNDLKIDEAVQAAKDADVVVMAVGEPKSWTGEGGTRLSLTLSGNQQALFDAVVAAGKPVVTIVFSGRPLSLPEVWEKSAAVLYAWQPGIQAGPGLADLLVGDVSPSARLTMSVPRSIGQVPLYYNSLRTGQPDSRPYFQDAPERDAKFWFGYGLTYTTFSYSDLHLVAAHDGQPAEAVATLTNTGTRDGDEVAQLYVGQVACLEGARPGQELRGFQHVVLKPGAKQEVHFPLTDQVLGYVNRKGVWKVDSGRFQVWISPHAKCGSPIVYTKS